MRQSLVFGIFAIAILSFSACRKYGDPYYDDVLEDQDYRLSVRADKAAMTKALSMEVRDGEYYLASYWETTDKVYVFKGLEATSPTGTLSPKTEGVSSVLEGTITGTPKKGDYLVFTSPSSSLNFNYTGQDGTLETIARKYDYIRAYATVNSVDGSEIKVDPLTFDPQQAIVKFTLVDASSNPVYPTKLTLTAKDSQNNDLLILNGENRGDLEINIDQTTPHNEIYAALSLMGTSTAASFKLVASAGEKITYTFEKNTDTRLGTGEYYEIKVKFSDLTIDPSLSLDDLLFNFNFLDNRSTLSKKGSVFVFFEGITTGYYVIHDDGHVEWQGEYFVDLGETSASDLVRSGKLTAVFIASDESFKYTEPVSYSDGKWVFNSIVEEGFEGWNYTSANKVQFSYTIENVNGKAKVCLNADINLVTPSGSPLKIATDKYYSLKFACNYLIPAGLASVSSDGTVNEVQGNAGDWINVSSGGYACARLTTPANFVPSIYKPESSVYYYFALQTKHSGEYSYYHLLDNDGSRLEVDSDTMCAHISSGNDDWIQVGPGYFVDLRGMTWWTTNLSDDRHSPLPHPWTTAELAWTTGNQWDNSRVSKSLSAATFDYNSELPETFKWNQDGYIYQIISVCGIKGFVYGDLSDLTKFIFLPFAGHNDFYFYADVGETELRYNYNWHYWAKEYHPDLLYHRTGVPGYDDHYWAYHSTSTLHFPSYNDSFYPYYLGTDIKLFYGSYGVPDYAIMSNDNQQLYFPARPVKK